MQSKKIMLNCEFTNYCDESLSVFRCLTCGYSFVDEKRPISCASCGTDMNFEVKEC